MYSIATTAKKATGTLILRALHYIRCCIASAHVTDPTQGMYASRLAASRFIAADTRTRCGSDCNQDLQINRAGKSKPHIMCSSGAAISMLLYCGMPVLSESSAWRHAHLLSIWQYIYLACGCPRWRHCRPFRIAQRASSATASACEVFLYSKDIVSTNQARMHRDKLQGCSKSKRFAKASTVTGDAFALILILDPSLPSLHMLKLYKHAVQMGRH